MDSYNLIKLALILILDMGGLLISFRSKRLYHRAFSNIFFLGFFSILTNLLAVMITDHQTLMFLESFYYFLVALQLTAFYALVWHYVHGKEISQMQLSFAGILMAADFFLLFFNIRTKFVFEIQFMYYNGVRSYRVINRAPGVCIHFGICLIIGLCILYMLLRKVYESSGIYRIRYLCVLLIIFLAGAVGLVNSVFDFSTVAIQFMNTVVIFLNYYLITYFIPDQLSKKTVSETLRKLNSGLVIFDAEGHLVQCNDIAYDMLQVPLGNEETLKERVEEQLQKHNNWDAEKDQWLFEYLQKDNSKRYIQINSGLLKDESNHVIGGYFNLTDQTQEQRTLQAEHFKATHDDLTGLLNKDGFYEAVAKQMKEEPNKEFLIICTNARDFKMINDLFGFDKGNEIIQRMATMLDMSTHKGEIVARIVADQFAIMSWKGVYDEKYLKDWLTDITSIIASSYYTMTVHCGIYEVLNKEMDISLMCDRANMAISTVRDRSDNQIVTYNDQMMSNILHDRQVASHLDSAMENNEFLIYLQPQVDKRGMPFGAEALVRWNDPVRGVLAPGAFIDILEKTGCLYRLDQHVWELAAKQLADWKGTKYQNLHISVNISPRDFYYLDIYHTFIELVDRYKIDPSKLKLEITETAFMNDPERQFKIINRMHNVGFEFEIDDFGSGYSSLSMLKDMPADILKIDMGFLRETENRERSKTILESVIKLAHELDMGVITEGVEKESQVEFLTEMGCSMFQGYFFSKPIPIEEFEAKYRTGGNVHEVSQI